MKKNKISVATALVLCLLGAMAGAFCTYAALGWHSQSAQTKLRELDAIVAKHYIGEIDETVIADYAAFGYLTGLGDKWSNYIPAAEYEAFQLSGEGQGIGIGVTIVQREDSIRVSEVFYDSPAQQAGIEKGDYIIGAERLTVQADGSEAVIDAIAGEEDSEVRVTIQKDGANETRELTMRRARVTQKMAWGEMLDNSIGYLRINNFHVGAAAQYQTVLDELLAQGAVSLVIDVRHNGGGRVNEMSDMLDPLLPEGTIMTLRTVRGKESVYASDEAHIELPVAVLVDESSISAAEFFAAALQEYGRATLIGTHTTGKGRAQQTFRLSDGSALALSTEEYFTPKGVSLAEVGIAPDIEVALSEEQRNDFSFLPRESDPQLQKALEILQ